MKISPLMIAGGGLAAWFLLKGNTPAKSTIYSPTGSLNTTGPTLTTPNAPALPSQYNDAYYKQYIYPAMVAANPNIKNPNYQLTAAEADQYFNNYQEVQDYWPTAQHYKEFPSKQAYIQHHWSTYGVPYMYTFLPLVPPKTNHYVPPQAPAGSGGGGFLSSVLSVATTVLPLILGTPGQLKLNPAEVDAVFTGSQIAKDILPFFKNTPGNLAGRIDNKINSVLTEHL